MVITFLMPVQLSTSEKCYLYACKQHLFLKSIEVYSPKDGRTTPSLMEYETMQTTDTQTDISSK